MAFEYTDTSIKIAIDRDSSVKTHQMFIHHSGGSREKAYLFCVELFHPETLCTHAPIYVLAEDTEGAIHQATCVNGEFDSKMYDGGGEFSTTVLKESSVKRLHLAIRGWGGQQF